VLVSIRRALMLTKPIPIFAPVPSHSLIHSLPGCLLPCLVFRPSLGWAPPTLSQHLPRRLDSLPHHQASTFTPSSSNIRARPRTLRARRRTENPVRIDTSAGPRWMWTSRWVFRTPPNLDVDFGAAWCDQPHTPPRPPRVIVSSICHQTRARIPGAWVLHSSHHMPVCPQSLTPPQKYQLSGAVHHVLGDKEKLAG
jgi:hypothetical protein